MWLLLLSELTGVSVSQPGPSCGQAVLLFSLANMFFFVFYSQTGLEAPGGLPHLKVRSLHQTQGCRL